MGSFRDQSGVSVWLGGLLHGILVIRGSSLSGGEGVVGGGGVQGAGGEVGGERGEAGAAREAGEARALRNGVPRMEVLDVFVALMGFLGRHRRYGWTP